MPHTDQFVTESDQVPNRGFSHHLRIQTIQSYLTMERFNNNIRQYTFRGPI